MNIGLKKLLKPKDWLTVPDAARHLSILFGVDVSEADVLRFALDGHLTLSVHFVNQVPAQVGKLIHREALGPLGKEYVKMSEDEYIRLHESLGIGTKLWIDNDRLFSYNDKVEYLYGIWDLPMIGAELYDVERSYQILTGGPGVESLTMEGPFVNRSDGKSARVLEHYENNEFCKKIPLEKGYFNRRNYYPAHGLPRDAVFVVRTSALQELEVRISEPGPALERPLKQRERDSLLMIIAALAELSGIDVKKPSKAAMEIESATIQKGARISARAIEDHLRRIPDALERKGAED
jgi:hypothetical protein